MNNKSNPIAASTPDMENFPKDYTYCPASDEICPRAQHCLRAIAYRQLPKAGSAGKPGSIRIVHPAWQAAAKEGCEYYRDNTPVRFARGMTKLFDDIPHRLEADMRRGIMACFSCRSYYFQSRKGERLITPHEQQAIANVFRQAGLNTVPVFDSYIETVHW